MRDAPTVHPDPFNAEKTGIQGFRTRANEPDSEEHQLVNLALAHVQGAKIASDWVRTQTFKRSTVDRQGAFKPTDEVAEMASATAPRKEEDAGRHPALGEVYETRTMGNL